MEEMNEDNLAPIEEAFSEDEALPEAAEVETGAFGLGPDNSSEDAVARYFIRRHDGNFLWVHDAGASGELATWHGSRWGIGGYRTLDACISDVCRELSMTLPAPDPESKKQDYRQKLLAARYQQGVRHIVLGHLGKSGPTCVSTEDFDTDPWVLGVNPVKRDGNLVAQVIDLRTGTIMDSGREARLTKRLRMSVDFNMPTPLWDQTLSEIMSGEKDRVDFMESLMGYSMSGSARHEIVVVLGSPAESDDRQRGRNGKGTITKVLFDIGGPYSLSMGSDVIVRGKHSETDKKRIYGAFEGRRIVVLSEVNESAGDHVDNSFVKELSGGDGGNGCDVYRPRKNVRQTWTMWIAQNGIMVLENTAAMRERIIYIDFKERFAGDRCKPQLKEQLRAEYPGILAKLVRACAKVYQGGKDGLKRPASIAASSGALFRATDYAERFCAEMLVKAADEDFISNPDIADAYKAYVERVGEAGASTVGGKPLARALAGMGGKRVQRGPKFSQKWGWAEVKFR
jgi:P4 family phage/plasmid primase-like protien